MKKNGFTLAEVLITLAIIGVVASLTLPALMTNTAEQQAITAFRKAVNTLSEVGQMSAAVDGFDYGGLSAKMEPPTPDTVDNNGVVKQTLWAMLSNRAQVDRTQSGSNVIKDGKCKDKNQIFFMDGTVLCYEDAITNASADAAIHGYIDTNGVKGPNTEFTCTNKECKPSERKVGDQFPVTLSGSVVYPGNVTIKDGKITNGTEGADHAARWAMRK